MAFSLAMTGSTTFNRRETIIYSDVHLDIGKGYHTGNGIYTVPVSGVYVFTWSTTCDPHDEIITELVVNGAVKGVADADCSDADDVHVSTGLSVVSVHRDDQVFVRTGDKSGKVFHFATIAWTTFSGWRLF